MKKILAFIILVLFFLVGGYFILAPKVDEKDEGFVVQPRDLRTQSEISPEEIDYKASFAIFTHGTFRIFTAAMYHNLSEDVFIQSSNPNIVHVKKSGLTWSDFFATLPFSLDYECLTTGTGQTFCDGLDGQLRFFLNGAEDPDALDREIENGAKLLVSFGDETDTEIQNQINQIPR